jgi:ABC transporter substrate binding protein
MRRAGQNDFQEFAREMVQLKADLIIVTTTPAALAAKNATATIPIVIPHAIDPLGAGLVASLAHPGGNVTGGTLLQAELSAKRLELLKEVLPKLLRTSLLWNVLIRRTRMPGQRHKAPPVRSVWHFKPTRCEAHPIFRPLSPRWPKSTLTHFSFWRMR